MGKKADARLPGLNRDFGGPCAADRTLQADRVLLIRPSRE